MLNKNMRARIVAFFTGLFKEYAVRIEDIPDEPDMIGVGVYGVESELVSAVSDSICDCQKEFPEKGTPEFIPMVRNVEATRRFYPSLLVAWTQAETAGHVQPYLALEWTAIPAIVSSARINDNWESVALCGDVFNDQYGLAA